MPIARRKRERLIQVYQWLRDEFPTPFPVDVHIVKKVIKNQEDGGRNLGECWRENKRIIIKIDGRIPLNFCIEVLIHEWSHAASMRHARLENLRLDLGQDHDEEWSIMYGRIYRRYNDQDGYYESGKYPTKRK